MGYHRAGFEVVGVDIKNQPRYPFEFHQADAMTYPLDGFDVIHASPPCQHASTIAKQNRALRPGKYHHPNLVIETRTRLKSAGVPFVIENVSGAAIYNAIILCGSSFGLDVRRHRLFESNHFIWAKECCHSLQKPRFRSLDQRRKGRMSCVVGVHGHINYAGESEIRKAAMDINWMSDEELTQAIPPAYTEFIGKQLMEYLNAKSNPG